MESTSGKVTVVQAPVSSKSASYQASPWASMGPALFPLPLGDLIQERPQAYEGWACVSEGPAETRASSIASATTAPATEIAFKGPLADICNPL